MELTIDFNKITKTDSFHNRMAVRGIISRNGRYLMVRCEAGDYKFPGGGMEPGEEYIDTLERELKEETGLKLIKKGIIDIGTVTERRGSDIIMTSAFFLCQAEIKATDKAVFVTLEEALEANRKVTDYERYPWVVRETLVLEYLLTHMERKVNIYDAFKCTADKCEFTCCKEWKIAVDEATYKKWNRQEKENTRETEDGRLIKLNENGICPFLDSRGLCSLVLEKGDKYISDTCQIFPRQINKFPDRNEYSLVACCPEVVDLINKADSITYCTEDNYDLYALRDRAISIISNKKYTVPEALIIAFYYLTADDFEETEVYDGLKNLQSFNVDTFEECNELFLDMSVNYVNEHMYEDFLKPLYDLGEDLSERGLTENEITDFLKVFSRYEELFRKYLVAEMFANLYLPEYDNESVLMAFEWIAMEYISMRQSSFLLWKSKGSLLYNDVKLSIVIISRMTGFDEPDIREYMENSFDEIVWDPGYLILIVGTGTDDGGNRDEEITHS